MSFRRTLFTNEVPINRLIKPEKSHLFIYNILFDNNTEVYDNVSNYNFGEHIRIKITIWYCFIVATFE